MESNIRFSNYYLAPGSRILSASLGLIIGGLLGLFLGLQRGILIGCGVALLCSFVLPLVLYLSDRPYGKLKAELKGPFLVDERVRFTIKGGSLGGFFVLTGDEMVFLSLENGRHVIKLSRGEVRSVRMNERGVIQVFLNDTQFVAIISGAAEEVLQIIQDNGWNVVGS